MRNGEDLQMSKTLISNYSVEIDVQAAARRWLFFRLFNKFTKQVFYILYRAVWRYFFARNTHSVLRKNKTKRILIIRPDHIGDFILTLPSMVALKSVYLDEYSFEILLNPCNASIANRLGIFDRVYLFQMFGPKREKLLPSCAEYHQIAQLIGDVDVLIDMRSDLTTKLLINWIKPNLTSRSIFSRSKKRIKEYESIFQFVQKLSCDLELKIENSFLINSQIAQKLLVKKFPVSRKEKRPVIGFCPEARLQKKVWSPEQIHDLIKQLDNSYGDCYTLLLIGEIPLAHQYQNTCVKDMLGKTTLDQAFELINTCQLFIGFDSGLTHLASLLGKPTIAIFNGYTNANKWSPISVNENLRILQPNQYGKPDITQVMTELSFLIEHKKDKR
jgi:ADP-heptose:LPS heptosyltransferase